MIFTAYGKYLYSSLSLMKVFIINGSPNEDKGNTGALVKAFAEGAKEAGHEVVIKNVGKKNINGCKACMFCKGQGAGKCAQKDDMQELYPEYETAEVVVLASPIYYFGMTAQTMAALQRVFCMGRPPKAKKAALLLSSGSPGVYDGAIATYKNTMGYLKIEDAGIVTANGNENKSDAKLAEAKTLGKKL